MAIAARHAGTVNEQGQLVLSDPSSWRAAIARHKGRAVWVAVVRQSYQRTLPQNKLYWLWIREIASYIGEDDNSVHEYLKAKFLPARDIELLDGQHMNLPPSTRRLGVEEFTTYMRNVQTWAAAFLGLTLPEGHQVGVTL